MFSHYRFKFITYLGNGEFLKDESGQNKYLTGIAVSIKNKLMLFGLPNPIEENGDFSIPSFESLVRKKSYKYVGKFVHQDFKYNLIELKPLNFDELLNSHKISIIGSKLDV